MYRVTVTVQIAAAHHLRGYQGKCENTHGHNYQVEATVQTPILNDTGLALDFGIARRELKAIADGFDHRDLNTLEEFQLINPSSENIARTIFEKLESALAPEKVEVHSIRVWETLGSCITYFKDGSS
jgi:6-pyruvoyltetrahydropterin/6-carboxytetrahydropterin synthase